MHQSQGVYIVFVLHPVHTSKSVQSVKSVVEYNPKDRELSTKRRISFWLQRSLFFTANGSYFVLMVSCLPTADMTGREVQTGKLACMDEHHYLAAKA